MTLPSAQSLRKDLAEAESRLTAHVGGARRANVVLTGGFIAMVAGLLTKTAWLVWPGLAALGLGLLEVLRRIRLITQARDERLDLMMALAAVESTPGEDKP
ncbi:MAG TPA: hypothetical protein VJ483_06730 [Holophagaceae bacterium]|nr:hypothetical protein [Holophagaceae bacterium]